MKELSIFVDESGEFGEYEKHAPFEKRFKERLFKRYAEKGVLWENMII